MIGKKSSVLWLGAAGVAVVTLGASVMYAALAIVPAVLDAEDGIRDLGALDVGSLVDRDASSMDEASKRVDEVESELVGPLRAAAWLGRFSSALAWFPLARQELDSWAAQARRIDDDLATATVMLDSSSRLLDVYSRASSSVFTGQAASAVPVLRTLSLELEGSFADNADAVRNSLDGRAFGVAQQLPRVNDLFDILADVEDRMLDASRIGQEVARLMLALLELADASQPLIAQFTPNGPESRDWTGETLGATLASVVDQAGAAEDVRRELAGLVAGSGQADELLPRLTALEGALSVMETVAAAASVGLDAVEPGVSLIEKGRSGLLADGEALLAIFDGLAEHRDEISRAVEELAEARRTLDRLAEGGEAARFADGLSAIVELVADLESGLRMARNFGPMGRELLGADGRVRYLVLGQSSDELRATGGFVSGVWLVTFEHGALADVRYEDAVRIDDYERIDLYPKAPLALEEHMNAWVWLMRDVSWDPDFPTTAQSARDMYRLGRRQEVDGVIAFNQWSLLELIEALGSVSPPEGGEPLTPRNLMSALEDGTDRYGRAYMDLVLQGLLDTLGRSGHLPTLIRVASALFDSLDARDTLVFFDDEGLQATVGDLGWDGRVRQGATDYLYTVDSNVGWSKVDRNIERRTHYTVDLKREPRPRAHLTLSYTNHSGPGSPGCEPQWLSRGTDYGHLKNACYWNLLRTYIPQQSRLLSATPLPLGEHTVSVEIGRGVPGQETGGVSSGHNRLVWSGLQSIEAGAQGRIELVYDLPEHVLVEQGDTLTYELMLQKQPGVRRRDVTVEVLPPNGYCLTRSSMPAGSDCGQPVRFSWALERDTILSVTFAKETE